MNHSPHGVGRPIKRWPVLSVGFRKEKAVLKSLVSKQFDGYVPLKERNFKYACKSVVRQLPILPGYVFVKVVKTKTFTILDMPFVFGLLKTGTNFSVVTEKEISHLRRLSSTEHLDWYDQPEGKLQEGTLVEIVKGPLARIRGLFVADKGRNVFLISFGDHLQTQLGTFEISPEDIVPLAG